MLYREPDSDGVYRASIYFAKITSSKDWFPPDEVKISASNLQALRDKRKDVCAKRLQEWRDFDAKKINKLILTKGE